MQDQALRLDESSFETTILAGDRPALVEFWAEWCGPCRRLAPILDELAREYGDRMHVAKVEMDRHPDLARRFHVNAAPTLLFFRGGQVVDRVLGLKSRAALKDRMEALVD